MKPNIIDVVALILITLALTIIALAFVPAKTISFVQEVEAQVRPTLVEQLVPVCACESSWEGTATGTPRHFDPDGSVRTGKVNGSDKGMCQINAKWHQADAEKMGLDIMTEDGNIEFANHLYKRYGLKPWKHSNACWSEVVK